MSHEAHRTEIAPEYGQHTAAIMDMLSNFETRGETLHRKRNTVKKMRLDDMSVVVKSFKVPRGISAFVYGQIRKGKARRSFEHAQRLHALGINTPDPIALIEQRQRGGLTASFYVCKHCHHDFSMDYAFANSDDGVRPHEADDIIEAFTRFTFELHEAGVLHRDHNASNTLVRSRSGRWEFAVIDINRMHFGPLSLNERLKNLVRLTDDIRVMQLMARTYAGLVGQPPELCETLLLRAKQRHWRKLALKRQIKKLLGKGPR